MDFDSGPIPSQQLDAEQVDQYGNPLPPVPQAPPASAPGGQGTGIDGPPLTPQQVKLMQRLAALWGFDGEEAAMGRERESLNQLQQSLTPRGRMIGDVYVRQGPAATLLGGALQGGLVGPRARALRERGDANRDAMNKAGRAAYQLQGLIPYEPEE